jgi:hypothetical protein
MCHTLDVFGKVLFKRLFVLIRVINLWLIYQLSSYHVFLSVMVM